MASCEREGQRWCIGIHRVHTALNLADMFTKPLSWFSCGFLRFTWLLSYMMYTDSKKRLYVLRDGMVPPEGCSEDIVRAVRSQLNDDNQLTISAAMVPVHAIPDNMSVENIGQKFCVDSEVITDDKSWVKMSYVRELARILSG